jgi:hypothetical protein
MLQALTVCTLLATAGMFAQVSWAAGAVDVSSHVKVTQSGFLMNRQTGIWTTTLTVTNTTGSSITGPIQVAVTNLSSNAGVVKPAGSMNGSPYVLLSVTDLAPGASVSVQVQFTNSTNGFITYSPVTFSGGI